MYVGNSQFTYVGDKLLVTVVNLSHSPGCPPLGSMLNGVIYMYSQVVVCHHTPHPACPASGRTPVYCGELTKAMWELYSGLQWSTHENAPGAR